jgi:hypothetical protein
MLSRGQYDRAIELYERALRIEEATLGEMHAQTAETIMSMGGAYENKGQNDRAIAATERALRICHQVLGPDHPQTLQTRQSLAISDPTPLEHGQGAGGDDARAARGREGVGKEVERVRLGHVPQIPLCRPHVVRLIGAIPTAPIASRHNSSNQKLLEKACRNPSPFLSIAHFLTPPVAVVPHHAFFLCSCSFLPNAVRCNAARMSCPASFVCVDDRRDAFGSSKCVASDGSIVDAVINVHPFEVAEMRDFGEFHSVTYAVDC